VQLSYPGVVQMKLSTRSSILKSTSVEILSPRIVECPDLEKEFKKLSMPHGVPADFSVFADQSESLLVKEQVLEYTLAKGQEEALALITQSKLEAENIIAEARQKAQQILSQAQQESEAIRQSVEQAVRDEVLPLAQAEGYEKGLLEAAGEADRIRKQAKAYLELAQRILMDEFHRADRELVNLCLRICERIVHSTLSLQPDKLLSIIRNLTLLPREKEGLKIHLAAKDWEWYKKLPAEDKPAYSVIVDETLRPGDAYLECAEGVFDARINSQLDKMEQFLLEELDHGRLDGFSEKD